MDCFYLVGDSRSEDTWKAFRGRVYNITKTLNHLLRPPATDRGRKGKKKRKKKLTLKRIQDVSACLQCLLCPLHTTPLPRPFLAYKESVITHENPWGGWTYHLPLSNNLDVTAKIFWLLTALSLLTYNIFLTTVMEVLNDFSLPSSSSIMDLEQN